MAFEEKRAWIMVLVSVCAYAIYLILVLGRTSSTPFAEMPYIATMLWCIGASIVTAIVANIVTSIATGAPTKKDQRDREIGRFGEYIGQSFVVLGGVAALLMAMGELPYFWIANAVYLAFTLSAILGSAARIFAYRRGFQTW